MRTIAAKESGGSPRDAKFAGYLDLWAKREGWRVRDKRAAAQVFAGLLKARIFDEVLLGLRQPSEAEIVDKAGEATKRMLLLPNKGRLDSVGSRRYRLVAV